MHGFDDSGADITSTPAVGLYDDGIDIGVPDYFKHNPDAGRLLESVPTNRGAVDARDPLARYRPIPRNAPMQVENELLDLSRNTVPIADFGPPFNAATVARNILAAPTFSSALRSRSGFGMLEWMMDPMFLFRTSYTDFRAHVMAHDPGRRTKLFVLDVAPVGDDAVEGRGYCVVHDPALGRGLQLPGGWSVFRNPQLTSWLTHSRLREGAREDDIVRARTAQAADAANDFESDDDFFTLGDLGKAERFAHHGEHGEDPLDRGMDYVADPSDPSFASQRPMDALLGDASVAHFGVDRSSLTRPFLFVRRAPNGTTLATTSNIPDDLNELITYGCHPWPQLARTADGVSPEDPAFTPAVADDTLALDVDLDDTVKQERDLALRPTLRTEKLRDFTSGEARGTRDVIDFVDSAEAMKAAFPLSGEPWLRYGTVAWREALEAAINEVCTAVVAAGYPETKWYAVESVLDASPFYLTTIDEAVEKLDVAPDRDGIYNFADSTQPGRGPRPLNRDAPSTVFHRHATWYRNGQDDNRALRSVAMSISPYTRLIGVQTLLRHGMEAAYAARRAALSATAAASENDQASFVFPFNPTYINTADGGANPAGQQPEVAVSTTDGGGVLATHLQEDSARAIKAARQSNTDQLREGAHSMVLEGGSVLDAHRVFLSAVASAIRTANAAGRSDAGLHVAGGGGALFSNKLDAFDDDDDDAVDNVPAAPTNALGARDRDPVVDSARAMLRDGGSPTAASGAAAEAVSGSTPSPREALLAAALRVSDDVMRRFAVPRVSASDAREEWLRRAGLAHQPESACYRDIVHAPAVDPLDPPAPSTAEAIESAMPASPNEPLEGMDAARKVPLRATFVDSVATKKVPYLIGQSGRMYPIVPQFSPDVDDSFLMSHIVDGAITARALDGDFVGASVLQDVASLLYARVSFLSSTHTAVHAAFYRFHTVFADAAMIYGKATGYGMWTREVVHKSHDELLEEDVSHEALTTRPAASVDKINYLFSLMYHAREEINPRRICKQYQTKSDPDRRALIGSLSEGALRQLLLFLGVEPTSESRMDLIALAHIAVKAFIKQSVRTGDSVKAYEAYRQVLSDRRVVRQKQSAVRGTHRAPFRALSFACDSFMHTYDHTYPCPLVVTPSPQAVQLRTSEQRSHAHMLAMVDGTATKTHVISRYNAFQVSRVGGTAPSNVIPL